MSLDSDAGFWKWLAGSVVAAGGSMFGYHKYIEAKINGKADKVEVANDLADVKAELAVQRTNVAKIFDQIRENEHRAQDRYERLMEKLR